MRLALLAVLVSSAASASPGQVAFYGLDPELVPTACQHVVTGTQMGARISVASCTANLALQNLSLTADGDWARQMATAVRYPVELLDSVITVGTDVERVEALRAKSDLYCGMISRMRRTAEQLAWHTTGTELDRATSQHDAIEDAISPWVLAVRVAEHAIHTISVQHPEIMSDPVARIAVQARIAMK